MPAATRKKKPTQRAGRDGLCACGKPVYSYRFNGEKQWAKTCWEHRSPTDESYERPFYRSGRAMLRDEFACLMGDGANCPTDPTDVDADDEDE